MLQSRQGGVNMDENAAGDDNNVLAPSVQSMQDLNQNELDALMNRPLVGADPNKRDLLYVASPNSIAI